MSTRLVTLSDEDLAALVAARPVIADAVHHPGRATAIAALDRLAVCDPVQVRDLVNREMAARLFDYAALMGGINLGEALQAMGHGFGLVLDLALKAWAEVCDKVHGDTATLQWIAAARLRA